MNQRRKIDFEKMGKKFLLLKESTDFCKDEIRKIELCLLIKDDSFKKCEDYVNFCRICFQINGRIHLD